MFPWINPTWTAIQHARPVRVGKFDYKQLPGVPLPGLGKSLWHSGGDNDDGLLNIDFGLHIYATPGVIIEGKSKNIQNGNTQKPVVDEGML